MRARRWRSAAGARSATAAMNLQDALQKKMEKRKKKEAKDKAKQDAAGEEAGGGDAPAVGAAAGSTEDKLMAKMERSHLISFTKQFMSTHQIKMKGPGR